MRRRLGRSAQRACWPRAARGKPSCAYHKGKLEEDIVKLQAQIDKFTQLQQSPGTALTQFQQVMQDTSEIKQRLNTNQKEAAGLLKSQGIDLKKDKKAETVNG